MAVKIQDNTGKIEQDFSRKANIFLKFLTDEVQKIAEPKTPKKTGDLRRSVLKQVLGLRAKIIWNKKYALIQETKQFRNYTTAGTGPNYARNAVENVARRESEFLRKAGLL